ncbi:hypothetical protein DFH29DRAFT_803550, partial [Suillus ampliporus]
VTWDIALASLALCVKFHRDFLTPLSPVYADEFLNLARHSISYEDLEVSQRDILSACGFSLGSITPQGYIDELWLALPTLRKAAESLKDGWVSVQVEIWDRLFDALIEPDVLQFPVSLLTASALLDGLIIAIARHYKAEADMDAWRFQRNSYCRCPAPSFCAPDNTIKAVPWQMYVCEAMSTVQDVVLDVQDVLQIREVSAVHDIRCNDRPSKIYTGRFGTMQSMAEPCWMQIVLGLLYPSSSLRSILLHHIDESCCFCRMRTIPS